MSEGIGKGTELWIGDGGGPETFTKVANILTVSSPEFGFNVLDITNQSTPNDEREAIAGLVTEKEMTVTMVWDPTETTQDDTGGMAADAKNKVKRNFEVRYQQAGFSSKTVSFSAFVNRFKIDSDDIEGVVTAEADMTIVGAITWT